MQKRNAMKYKNIGEIRDRIEYIKALDSNVDDLDLLRVNECKEAVWQSYKAATIHDQIARVVNEDSNTKGFRSIGLRSSVETEKFNASNYYWKPYFSDIGRAIANGERKYLHKTIGTQIRGGGEPISWNNPDFRILNDRIESLLKDNLDPDTILAPVQLMVSFHKFFRPNIKWLNDGSRRFRIKDAELTIFWSHKYAPLRSFIVFNSKAGIWNVIPDIKTGRVVTIAIGKSLLHPGRIEYWAETIARYQISDKAMFARINLTK